MKKKNRSFAFCIIRRIIDPWRTSSGYSIAGRYLVQGLFRDLDLAVFAPVGQRYSVEYYFPELGVFGYEDEFEIILPSTKEGEPPQTFYTDSVIPIYPAVGGEGYGEDIVEEHFQDFQAEVILTCGDSWPLVRIPELAKQNRMRWVCSPAVDFLEPIPQEFLDKLKPAMYVVPWVKDGMDRLKGAGLQNLWDEPIPLPVNTDIWQPVNRAEYPDTMANLGFSYDSFNISMIAANQQGRKAWEQSLRGIKIFREKHPDIPTRLYIHSLLNQAEGWDMQGLVANTGMGDVTKFSSQYHLVTNRFSERKMMLMHALADVVLTPGLEGFGYASVQAGAVGTPVIGLQAGATPELLQKVVLVPPYYDYLTPNFLHKVDPHPLHIAEALATVAIDTPRSDYRENIDFVRKNFSVDVVVGKWRKFFAELDSELERKCIKSRAYPPAPSEREKEMSAKMVEITV